MRVSIDVETPELGDLLIRRDDQVGGYTSREARGRLVELLTAAVLQTCRAYEIDPISVSSRIARARGPADRQDDHGGG